VQTFSRPKEPLPAPLDSPATRRLAGKYLDLVTCLGLILTVLAVYAQVAHFDFTNYDDPGYVSENVHVRTGLTPENIRWAFSAVVVGNWMPVTLLSHMLDCRLFGMDSGMHHLVNVIFHILSALLLFAVLRRTTGVPDLSAFVAAIFAVHPLHVQSVAWVAERKDVFSAFFYFLGLYCYARYTERPNLGRYLLVLVPFCLGLMAKPMLVTFPFVLLLFDVWPLRRSQWPRTLVEKLPLFALSAGSSIVTYLIQRSAGAVQSFPLALRTQNALISYVTYVRQALWPSGLAAFYPFPRSIPVWESAAALFLLLAVSALAIRAWRTRPYFAMGWFWYLGTLVPVIGLVQVGEQAHADRYMYIPLVGLSILLAWGAADLAAKWRGTHPFLIAAATWSCVGLCIAVSWKQTTYWQNSETLFQHAIDVTKDNWLAEGSLGECLRNQPGRRADAVDHLEAALRIEPNFAEAHNNLGLCLFDAGLCQNAIPHFEAALRAKPGSVQPLNNLGLCLMNSPSYANAIPYFQAALRAEPDSADIHLNLGMALSKLPDRAIEASAHYQVALRLRPDFAEAHFELGMLLSSLGRTAEAISELKAGQLIHPNPQIADTIEELQSR
jgi:tetratricopeptide (TPR) repeat protein